MNTKIILAVVLAIIVVAAWAVNAHRNKSFRTVSSNEFAQIIGDTVTVQLVDVRTKEDYEEGHIADALLLDGLPRTGRLPDALVECQYGTGDDHLYSPQDRQKNQQPCGIIAIASGTGRCAPGGSRIPRQEPSA